MAGEAVRLQRSQKCHHKAIFSCELLRRCGSCACELLRGACEMGFVLEPVGGCAEFDRRRVVRRRHGVSPARVRTTAALDSQAPASRATTSCRVSCRAGAQRACERARGHLALRRALARRRGTARACRYEHASLQRGARTSQHAARTSDAERARHATHAVRRQRPRCGSGAGGARVVVQAPRSVSRRYSQQSFR